MKPENKKYRFQAASIHKNPQRNLMPRNILTTALLTASLALAASALAAPKAAKPTKAETQSQRQPENETTIHMAI